MAAAEQGTDLVHVVALLGAAVIAVPLFKRAGLGSVLGYLAAGLAIGPFGLRLFTDPQAILHVAELGVVMFLFVIGLEMQPSRLWSLRREIFGLGVAQVAAVRRAAHRRRHPRRTFADGGVPRRHGLRAVLDRHRRADPRRARRHRDRRPASAWCRSCCSRTSPSCRCSRWWRSWRRRRRKPRAGGRWLAIGIALAAIAALLAAGRWLLNPLFRMLADAHAREVMTAAALLVVLGAALVMQVERAVDGDGRVPRRRAAVGIDASATSSRPTSSRSAASCSACSSSASACRSTSRVIARHWPLILVGVPAYMLVKSAGIYIVARLFKAQPPRRRSIAPRCWRRAASSPSCSMPPPPASACSMPPPMRDPHRDRDHLDGAHAARRVRAALAAARGRAIDGRRRRSPRICTAACCSSASAVSARWRASRCWRADRRVDHRHRHRDDPRRRATFGFKVYYGDGTGSTCCRPPAPARPRRSWSASTSATRPTGSSRSSSRNFRSPSCWSRVVRPRARAQAGRRRRRFADPRDVRVGAQVRRGGPARARRSRGRGGRNRGGHPSARRRAIRAGNHRRSSGGPRPPARQRADAGPLHHAQAKACRRAAAHRRCGKGWVTARSRWLFGPK